LAFIYMDLIRFGIVQPIAGTSSRLDYATRVAASCKYYGPAGGFPSLPMAHAPNSKGLITSNVVYPVSYRA